MSCPRLFEVEASRDGRLSGAERASFERHLTQCEECTGEAAALAKLAALVRARPDHVDELRAPRARIRLVGAYDRALTEPAPRRPQAITVLLLAGLALAAVYILVRAPSTPNVALRDRVPAVASTAPVPVPVPDETAMPSALPSARPARTPVANAATEPEDEYRAALAKLEAGDDLGAAAAFERFTTKYPQHVHAEDAAYLRVLAFQHAGDHTAVQSAAAAYLRTFPQGFRAKEVEKLAAAR